MDNLDDMVATLRQKHEVFQKLFDDSISEYHNLTPEERAVASDLLKAEFPQYPHTVQYLSSQWVLSKVTFEMNQLDEPSCAKDIFDSGSKKYVKAQVLPAQRKRRLEKFNLGEFFRQKRSEGDFSQINLQDRDMIEDLMEDINEDKARNDQRADIALNKIVQMAAIFNGCLPYRLIELHSERRIH